ncbi:uncharacterized protein LOC134198303 isoform X2 [Corticium candelabrum]|uniref:uncharacterized protein LOC134198303 isoform X2 n=1 Tax=Corticium candelabrum TaxID=121492 RepID=UPI002E258D3C|nr:uncharacterized protein LOC134198303 isoform X2 [Corticium candelabrum]
MDSTTDERSASDDAAPAAAAPAPAPECEKIVLSSEAEQDTYPFDSAAECWSMVSLKAPVYEPSERASIDLVAVVDKSGSMSGEKISLVRETLHFVVDQLKDTDRLGIVSYDTKVYDDLRLKVMNQRGKSQAHAVIDKLKEGSSTNLSGGLERGLEYIEQLGTNKKDVSSVLLMTDGMANQGVTAQPDILRRMTRAGRRQGSEENASSARNAEEVAAIVHTFGFGSDHLASLLEAISEKGQGMYYFIDNNEKIPEAFADCLGGLLSTVGQNVTLTIATKNGTHITKVHHRRAGALTDSSTKCEVKIGDVQSEEQRDIVIQLQLPQLQAPQPEPEVVLEAELSYFNAITSMMEKDTTSICVRRPADVPAGSLQSKPTIDLQRNRVIAAEAMKRATELADGNKLEEARAVIAKATAVITDSCTKDESQSQYLLADLNKSREQLSSHHAYRAGGNFMYMQAQSHAVQRSSAADNESYSTPRKMGMKSLVSKKK